MKYRELYHSSPHKPVLCGPTVSDFPFYTQETLRLKLNKLGHTCCLRGTAKCFPNLLKVAWQLTAAVIICYGLSSWALDKAPSEPLELVNLKWLSVTVFNRQTAFRLPFCWLLLGGRRSCRLSWSSTNLQCAGSYWDGPVAKVSADPL